MLYSLDTEGNVVFVSEIVHYDSKLGTFVGVLNCTRYSINA